MAQRGVYTTSDYLEYNEFLRLLDCLHKDKNYLWELYACISFSTAFRISDVLSKRWLHILEVDDKTQTFTVVRDLVVVERKTGKFRKLSFSNDVREKILELYHLLGKPDLSSFIIENKRTKKPYTREMVNLKLKQIKARYSIDIGNFSSHTFRKTFSRWYYDRSENKSQALIELMRLLNHRSPEDTKTYIHITSETLSSIYRQISLKKDAIS